MTNSKSLQFRKFHRAIAPIMALPLLLTAITGSIYQITDLSGKEVKWLLEVHTALSINVKYSNIR